MTTRVPKLRPIAWVILLLLFAAGAGAATSSYWLPWAKSLRPSNDNQPTKESAAHDDHEEGHGHDHGGGGHAGHSEDTSIKLSANGLKNIGFRPFTVEVGSFTKTTTLPAMVAERPGRSQLHVTAPLTGVITKIMPTQGATVVPGDSMFEMRLTHDELVSAQAEFIRTAESLEVVNREIKRLMSIDEGIREGKRVRDQEYEKQKLEASLRAERQALLLHGLTDEQVDGILKDRKLFQFLTVKAPQHADDSEKCQQTHPFSVQDLPVKVGQQVESGAVLSVLSDHCELYVEGRAFEDDATHLRDAARMKGPITAVLMSGEREAGTVENLQLLFLADHIDPDSRAFRFYLNLPNEIVLDQTSANGQRFVDWKFKPGQRMELRVPVEKWDERIVLPVEAVVQEGPESYVYQQNGEHFDRVPVHVEFRDRNSVVVANDGSVFPGDVIAGSGAYQMHLALKNKSGGGIDPHAGHNH